MKIKKIYKIILIISIIFINSSSIANAADINLTIRSGNTIFFSGPVTLREPGNIELNSHPLNSNSVLSVINDADISSEDFTISDIQYYDSYGSFYLKCMTSSVGNDCDNWQYTVDDIYPGIGMDKKILSGGENLYVYFGPQNKILLSSNSINTNETVTVTTKEYNYQDNSWKKRTGITVGLTQTNPDDPWSPLEIKTSPVNENGEITFSNIETGSYNVGVKEDFYFPTEILTVTTPPNIGGSTGGSSFTTPEINKKEFNIEKAIEFLLSKQKEDGSFGEDLYTDWVAISLTPFKDKENVSKTIEKLKLYFKENKNNQDLLTDKERKSIALLSLGLDPHNTNNKNYIKEILETFDGKQFGENDKDNDDIFALLILQKTGYNETEDVIIKTIDFILSRQKENGSWDESIDMTSAAIQSLSKFNKNEIIKNSLTKAKEYLKIKQKEDGSFGNVSSTAWAMGGILALSEKPIDWTKNNNTPIDYLTSMQDENGNIKDPSSFDKTDEHLQNKIWQTAYTLSALSQKTWLETMEEFKKPTSDTTEENLPTNLKSNIKKTENKKSYSKKNTIKKELIDINTKNQSPSTTILPASTSTLSTFLRFFKTVFDKIL
ncbi:MAG: terpene cyclase/mutase family protein [Burkholderiales bacterium]|nr:terpene cyclase/mutase family protein [Burkholderiales bacterium]